MDDADQFLRVVDMYDDRMKNLAWLLLWVPFPVGSIPLLGGVAKMCSTFPWLVWTWWLSPGVSLDLLNRHDGGALNVAPLLGALCLETGGPMVCSSGTHRCPDRSLSALCTVVAD